MNIKKVGLFVSMLPLLVSCNKNPYLGEYVFQMGKSKDTHISISLKLLEDEYKAEEEVKGQKFELGIDLLTNDVKDDMTEILNEVTPLTGYYRVNKEEKVYGETRLNVGVSILGEYEIPENITDSIFLASITSQYVNFYLPVSFEDLQFQLYWYGFDLNIANFFGDDAENKEGTSPTDTPEGKHPVGTHPTKEDVELINQHYSNDHDGKTFRDFHVLKLGLTKK